MLFIYREREEEEGRRRRRRKPAGVKARYVDTREQYFAPVI